MEVLSRISCYFLHVLLIRWAELLQRHNQRCSWLLIGQEGLEISGKAPCFEVDSLNRFGITDPVFWIRRIFWQAASGLSTDKRL